MLGHKISSIQLGLPNVGQAQPFLHPTTIILQISNAELWLGLPLFETMLNLVTISIQLSCSTVGLGP